MLELRQLSAGGINVKIRGTAEASCLSLFLPLGPGLVCGIVGFGIILF